MGGASGEGRIVTLDNGVRIVYDIYAAPPAGRWLGLIDIQEPVPGLTVDQIKDALASHPALSNQPDIVASSSGFFSFLRRKS